MYTKTVSIPSDAQAAPKVVATVEASDVASGPMAIWQTGSDRTYGDSLCESLRLRLCESESEPPKSAILTYMSQPETVRVIQRLKSDSSESLSLL